MALAWLVVISGPKNSIDFQGPPLSMALVNYIPSTAQANRRQRYDSPYSPVLAVAEVPSAAGVPVIVLWLP
jgi:hypothetical protein